MHKYYIYKEKKREKEREKFSRLEENKFQDKSERQKRNINGFPLLYKKL